MKIVINQILPDGLILSEDFSASALDLETDIIKFSGPVKVQAMAYKITNAVTVHVKVDAVMQLICSRCLENFKIDFKKDIDLNYLVSKNELSIDASTPLSINGERSRTIDLDPDIREEIILDYPIKPLCRPICKGLCLKCGKNLNEEKCNCVVN